MRLGRVEVDGPDGPVARLVLVEPDRGRLIDLALAERERLRRQGATDEAARRIAAALFPPSMAAAIGAGPLFTEASARAVEVAAEVAVLPLDRARWLAPLDPPWFRGRRFSPERHAG
jgi:hypothetical protein